MKNIFKSLILVGSMFAMTGCEDFLTRTPETNLSPSTFFASERELELWTNRFYNLFVGPDDAIQVSDIQIAKNQSAVQQGTRSPATESWSSSWNYLRYINYYLERSGNCSDVQIRNRYDGVAYFFRGLFYFDKVRRYGDVPYYEEVITSDDWSQLRRPRDNRAYVMLRVMRDFDKAIELLPSAWPSDKLYRLSKNAACALKARAALYEGTFRKYHNIPNVTIDNIELSADYFLKEAELAAKEVIDSKKYSLYTGNTFQLNAPYREFFILEDGNDKETILSMRFNNEIPIRHGVQFNYRNMRHSMTRRFTNHYLMKDGAPIQEKSGYETISYFEQFVDRDPRMSQTIMAPGYVALNGLDEEIENCKDYDLTGYRIIKFISDNTHDGATTSTSDWSIYRYPEVLLIYAEAKAELGTITQSDIDETVNLIRKRVNMPPLDMAKANSNADALMLDYYPNVTKNNNTGVILEIRRERTIELCCEGQRQWDMFRWREGAKMVSASNGTEGFLGCYFPSLGEYDMNGDGVKDLCLWSGKKPASECESFLEVGIGKDVELTGGDKGYIVCFKSQAYKWNEERDYLWPIPSDQRVITEGILTQNPGYDDALGF